jgi:hypothetical protein
MNVYECDEQLVSQRRVKWSESGVPHKGWTCVHIEDLEEPDITCEMCESQNVRYVHHMQHQIYPDILKVGCVCAGHLNAASNRGKWRETEQVVKTLVNKKMGAVRKRQSAFKCRRLLGDGVSQRG